MPVDRATIDSQIQALGPESVPMNNRNRERIRQEIEEGETINTIFAGDYDGTPWIIVVTDRRFLFRQISVFFSGQKRMEWSLSTVSASSFTLGDYGCGSMELSMGGVSRIIKGIPGHKRIPKIYEIISRTIQELQGSRSRNTQASEKEPQASEDVISRLERLANLKQQGVLTEEEFMQQKARILGS